MRSAEQLAVGEYRYGFHDPEQYVYKAPRGLTRTVVEEISSLKGEPQWMREIRLRAYEIFLQKPVPTWGADLSGVDFDAIHYYVRPTDRPGRSWEDLPEEIRRTFDRLGIPEAEKRFLAGLGAQYESEMVYHSLRESLKRQGVVFLDMDSGLREFPDLVREYFGSVVPAEDNKFAALNTAVWSGGSFIYVPKGVQVDVPLQAYFRINTKAMGQFERTLIIADEGSFLHYIEGCTAPIYSEDSLHAAVVEIIVRRGARVRYTTIQNWSTNVYNLVTKRALVDQEATMEWVDGNIGSKVTMKYPAAILKGRGARAEILSMAMAGKGQQIDAGAKVIHLAPDTYSHVVSKSISHSGGRTSYRGLVRVRSGALRVRNSVRCDALILDDRSRSDTYPHIDIQEPDAQVGHEATASRIGEEQLFYLMSRGLRESDAAALVVRGFIEPVLEELPMEYAVELNRLIELQMEGAIG
ncbi:MAG: Fe-S cluster assembly protein SufB [candidate division KSB1 bacterium]|nr:Fe-S cluster assembly protein SufB [candidate division KSB1 bacterium]